MTNEEILTNAIEKAIAGGWLLLKDYPLWNIHKSGYAEDRYVLCVPAPKQKAKAHIGGYEVIFDHDFAKAIAGDDWTKFLCDLVVEENPIQELAKWL